MSFSVRRQIRFADVDPAGIVFYPRYFEMLNAVIEDWFDSGLDYGFQPMIVRDGFGVPLVRCEVDFKTASRLDDWLDFDLVVRAVGRSSISLDITARCGTEVRLIAHMVLVYLNSEKHAPARIPDALKARMLDYREAA